MGIRTRLIAATMAAATLTAVVGAATASAVPASPTASAPSDGKKPGADDATLAKVAASLHISVQQLVTALDNLKQALGKGADKSVALGAFAKELGVSIAQAEKVLQELSGEDKKPTPGKDKQPSVDEIVKLLAAELHVSGDRARQVYNDLDKVKARGEDIVKDPAFIAIAKGLGITPEQLLAALRKVKQELADKPKEQVPSGSPAK
jgi:3-oxoacyl-ACP reductase-like protein